MQFSRYDTPPQSVAEEIVATFLATPFEGGRHARRVEQLMALEEEC